MGKTWRVSSEVGGLSEYIVFISSRLLEVSQISCAPLVKFQPLSSRQKLSPAAVLILCRR